MGFEDIENFGKKTPKEKTAFSIDKPLMDKLRKIAEAKNLSMSAIVNDLIKVYVGQAESLI